MYLGRMVAASGDVFPRGVMVLGVEAAIDFDARQQGQDRQATDEKTGLPVWNLTGIDMRGLDPEERAKGFRGSPEVKVRLLSQAEPQVPASKSNGLGAVVQFQDLMVTPYLDQDRCNGGAHRCRAQLKYSLRAAGIAAFRG
jgi:hypothetical protein